MTPERVLEIAVVNRMFRKALRRGLEELDKRAGQRHVGGEVELNLDFWAAEAAVAALIAQVFTGDVSADHWETHLSAHCFSAEEGYQQTMQVVCRQHGSNETDVRLEASVSSVPEEDWEEGNTVSHSFGLQRDPPDAVFEPAIRDLEAVADEVMREAGGQCGRVRKRFEHAEFEMQIPLPRRQALEAIRSPFEKLPAYEGEVGITSFLRLKEVPVGAGTISLRASVHQEPDEANVTVEVESLLRSADARPEVERRLDEVVRRLKAPT
jgi:hypothetical protein